MYIIVFFSRWTTAATTSCWRWAATSCTRMQTCGFQTWTSSSSTSTKGSGFLCTQASFNSSRHPSLHTALFLVILSKSSTPLPGKHTFYMPVSMQGQHSVTLRYFSPPPFSHSPFIPMVCSTCGRVHHNFLPFQSMQGQRNMTRRYNAPPPRPFPPRLPEWDTQLCGGHQTLLFQSMQGHHNVTVHYSTPSCYTKALHDSAVQWDTKDADYFPYASGNHTYWTGYFTSRPTFKGLVRQANNYLQVRFWYRERVFSKIWDLCCRIVFRQTDD